MTTGAPAIIENHVTSFWPARPRPQLVPVSGPVNKSIVDFSVAVCPPASPTDAWVYVSVGAWSVETQEMARYEFVVTSPLESAIHFETLAMVAHFHADPRYAVYPGKVLNIGRPWLPGSTCTHLLVSRPFPFGPDFERCVDANLQLRLLWLMPITTSEAEFARTNGVDALEDAFEQHAVDTLDPTRVSIA